MNTDFNLDAFPKSLLTINNPKTEKGKKDGYMTAIMHLAPHKASGVANMCSFASAGCAAACLNTAGQGGMGLALYGMNGVQAARIQRTRLFKRDRNTFMDMLTSEVQAFEKRAKKLGFIPVLRINGTSDLNWEKLKADKSGRNIFQLFPDLTFYDYTAWPIDKRGPLPDNYSLTMSLKENNDLVAYDALCKGTNVAVVFDLERSDPMPETWRWMGEDVPVINGDETDLRFLDPKQDDGRGLIVGLKKKGGIALRKMAVDSGFARAV